LSEWDGVRRPLYTGGRLEWEATPFLSGVIINIDTQEFLDLAELSGRLVFFDIEAVGLRGDYNSTLCISCKPYGQQPETFAVRKPGDDKEILKKAVAKLEDALVWCGYYSKGFDIPFIRTRLLKHGLPDIQKRLHLDMYFSLKANLLTSRKSQAHLLSWLKVPEQKMTVSADDWNEILVNPKKIMPTMIARCESDCAGLEALYKKTRHLIKEVKR
jgi:uncharacterized protein YprB with RNaseH-like and TPR domain